MFGQCLYQHIYTKKLSHRLYASIRLSIEYVCGLPVDHTPVKGHLGMWIDGKGIGIPRRRLASVRNICERFRPDAGEGRRGVGRSYVLR